MRATAAAPLILATSFALAGAAHAQATGPAQIDRYGGGMSAATYAPEAYVPQGYTPQPYPTTGYAPASSMRGAPPAPYPVRMAPARYAPQAQVADAGLRTRFLTWSGKADASAPQPAPTYAPPPPTPTPAPMPYRAAYARPVQPMPRTAPGYGYRAPQAYAFAAPPASASAAPASIYADGGPSLRTTPQLPPQAILAAPAAPNPPSAPSAYAAQPGAPSSTARLYSVHRDFGLTPDPAPIPPQFFAATADLSAPETPDVAPRATTAGTSTSSARAAQNAARLAAGAAQ